LRTVLFLVAIGMAALVLQTTSWGFLVPAAYKPDLILILVLWVSLRMTFAIGAGFAFAVGLAIDVLSGSPTGLFALIYCLLFVTCGYLHSTFRIDVLSGKAVTVFGATLAAGGIVFLVRWLSGPFELGWSVSQWVLLKSLVAAMASLVVFPVVDRMWAGFSRLVGEH
jgi:rod shape-determining protein MreD